jgi:hypothetical protein
MRSVDAYAHDYVKEGKFALSRQELEKELIKLIKNVS